MSGEIVELERQSAVPYLFYETTLNLRLPFPTDTIRVISGNIASRASGAALQDWVPSRPELHNGLEMERGRAVFIEYIEDVLANIFHFDCRQRTDLVTSLLGSITYERVLFRFLSMEEINSAASITVHPQPDVSVRVFLLYGDAASLDNGSSDESINTVAQDQGPLSSSSTMSLDSGSVEPLDLPAGQLLPHRTDGITKKSRNIGDNPAGRRNTDWATVVFGTKAQSQFFSNAWHDTSTYKL